MTNNIINHPSQTHICAADLVEERITGFAHELHDLGQLFNVIVAREQCLARQQLGHDATNRPNINCNA